jgi:chemotaxis-related protein WspD
MTSKVPEQPAAIKGPASQGVSATEIDTCWHRIGVYGNGQCPELKEFIHCRNCPVYSAAAQQLLDRPLPEEYRREWTAHFARNENFAPPVKTSAVLFRINAEWLALPAQAFQEVAERRPVHSLPHRRLGIVLGLANIRGELLICVGLAKLLGLEKIEPPQKGQTASERLLVANWEGARLVFPVDEVHGIHRFQASELREPPATVSKANASYTQGIFFWREKPVGFLEPASLFSALNRSLT